MFGGINFLNITFIVGFWKRGGIVLFMEYVMLMTIGYICLEKWFWALIEYHSVCESLA